MAWASLGILPLTYDLWGEFTSSWFRMEICQLRFKERYFHQLDLWLLHRKGFTLEMSQIYYYAERPSNSCIKAAGETEAPVLSMKKKNHTFVCFQTVWGKLSQWNLPLVTYQPNWIMSKIYNFFKLIIKTQKYCKHAKKKCNYYAIINYIIC